MGNPQPWLRRPGRWALTCALTIGLALPGWLSSTPAPTTTERFATRDVASVRATADPVVVVAKSGTSTAFSFQGTNHTVTLVSIAGESAVVQFSPDATQVVLSTTSDETIDLTSDTVPDATASLQSVDSSSQVTIELTPLPAGTWDESSFKTAGGLRPWDVNTSNGSVSSALVSSGGRQVLFTISSNRKVAWQRYQNSGKFVSSPTFGAGLLPPAVSTRYAVNSLDAVGVPQGFVVATELKVFGGYSNKGVALVTYDSDLRPIGPPLLVAGWRPRLAYDGHHVWLVTTDRKQLALTELSAGTAPTVLATFTPITPPSGRVDGQPDIAVDQSSGRLVLAWGRFATGKAGEVHLAVLGATGSAAGHVIRQLTVATGLAGNGYYPQYDAPDVLAAGGSATVLWRYGNPDRVHTATVNLDKGEVTRRTHQAWAAITGSDPLFGELILAKISGTMRMIGLRIAATKIGKIGVARYQAYRLRSGGFDDKRVITLDGGFPFRPDVLVDLTAYKQDPQQAVVGSGVVLEGAVENRGTQAARNVTVQAVAASGVIGTITVGTMQPFASQPVAFGWTVPSGTTAEQVPVALRVSTSSEQYTKGNDVAQFSVQILQHGLIDGWVVDDSYDIHHTSDYFAGLADADVDLGGTHLLSGDDGFFRVDNLAFGSYPISVSKSGYKTVTGSVQVTPTHPFGMVVLHTDNHGVLELHVVKQDGTTPLSGADVTVIGAQRDDKTPSNGIVSYDVPAGTYHLAITKRGYTANTAHDVQVNLGTTTTDTVALSPASAATATGDVVDTRGVGVAGATVQVIDIDNANTVIQTVSTGADGSFGPLSLPASTSEHSYVLRATKSGNPYTATDQLNVYGGDVRSTVLALIPSPTAELHGVSASQGYTSWMVHAGFPGFAALPKADMYVWMGNYGIKVSAEYWDDSHELVGVDVSAQGNSYESHATKSEIDFTEMQGDDFSDLFKTTNLPSGAVELGGFFLDLVTEHGTDLIDLAGKVSDLINPEDAIDEGQATHVLPWKKATEDFRVIPEFDSTDPIKSVFDQVVSVPTGFAIPIVIGGSSLELTSVRVDQVDVVDASSYKVLWSSEASPTSPAHSWYSWQGPDGTAGANTKRYTVATAGIDERNVLIEVFLRVGKIRPSASGGGTDVYGTSFDQREEQVVIFRPGTKSMTAQIASGDLYRNGALVRPAP